MNIIDYVKKNKSTFAEQSLNEVDSLVFAELAYLGYSRAASRAPAKTLGELADNIDGLVGGTLSILRKHNVALLKAIRRSPRFSSVRAGYFRQRNSDSRDERFAAITFALGDGTYHISYRGTGVSLVGWRENFKMSLMSVIPTQRIALKYLVQVASLLDGKFTVGGLSKGGNLAVFSSTFAPAEIKARIIAVYDHDGPGFKESIFEDERYLEIASRIHKTVPHDSIVGMLLTASQVYEVVDSSGVSIGQHDPFTWIVKDCRGFKKLPRTTRNSHATDAALTAWLAEMDERTRRRFVYAVFSIVEGSGAKEVGDFLHRPLRRIRLMRKSYEQLAPSDKELIAHGGKQLLSLWFGELFARARSRRNKPQS